MAAGQCWAWQACLAVRWTPCIGLNPGFWAAPMQGEFIVVLDCDMGELGFRVVV